MAKRKPLKIKIKRPGALTRLVGGPPTENISKVRSIAAKGTPLQKKQANLFLNIFRKAIIKKRAKRSLLKTQK